MRRWCMALVVCVSCAEEMALSSVGLEITYPKADTEYPCGMCVT